MSWHDANQAYLVHEIAVLRSMLHRHSGVTSGEGVTESSHDSLELPPSEPNPPPAIEQLCAAFGLSGFERAILLLCAGVELDSSFARAVAAAQSESRQVFPTFGLALAALPEPHWSALSPAGALRHWRLVDLATGDTLTTARIRIDERVLHYLAGVSHLDERLAGLLERITLDSELPQSQLDQVHHIVTAWTSAGGAMLPVIQLCGTDQAAKRAIAITACVQVGLSLYSLRIESLPLQTAELDAFMRLWQRETILGANGLMIETGGHESREPQRDAALVRILDELRGIVIVSHEHRKWMGQRRMVTLDVSKPTKAEQRILWQEQLGETVGELNGKLDAIGDQFTFSTSAIRSVSDEALQTSRANESFGTLLWEACRAQARPRMNDLAQRITATTQWDDLVLPELQKHTLRQIVTQLRQRSRVYEHWGFGGDGVRGLGISALFAGPSGTGKTMAAEVLATELTLDLYRIDLSHVVSKYIGETEKNLRRVFDAAEAGGVILLFDEADALFGKRSEVKDSHDRYANIEISYLLQRMEAYSGLAILTTNMKSALDTAFLRRLRFVVQFPFPDAAQRAEIWRRIFPTQTPTEGLDVHQLARLQVAGGNIRNMALNAAFLAAETNQPVGMSHILQAAKSEYAKLERPLAEAEIGGWR